MATAIFGTVMDIISTTLMSKPLPQMAPLFISLPVGTMYYSAKHYGLMYLNKDYSAEIIVTEEDRKKHLKIYQ